MLPVSYQSEFSMTTCVLPSPAPTTCVTNIHLPHTLVRLQTLLQELHNCKHWKYDHDVIYNTYTQLMCLNNIKGVCNAANRHILSYRTQIALIVDCVTTVRLK